MPRSCAQHLRWLVTRAGDPAAPFKQMPGRLQLGRQVLSAYSSISAGYCALLTLQDTASNTRRTLPFDGLT